MIYSASRKIWVTIAEHVLANRMLDRDPVPRPLLAGNISPTNAQRIISQWL